MESGELEFWAMKFFFKLIFRIQIEDALENRWHHPVQPNCRQESELVIVNKIEIGDKLKLEILFEGEKIYELRLVLLIFNEFWWIENENPNK